MDVNQVKSQLVDLVGQLEKVVPYASALYKRSSGTRIQINRVQENVEPVDPSEGLVVTLWNGQRFFESATNQWEGPTTADQLIAWARDAAAQKDSSHPSTEIDPGPSLQKDYTGPMEQDPALTPLESRLHTARSILQKTLAQSSQVSNAVCVLANVTRQDIYVNRHKVLTQKINRMDLVVMAFVGGEKKMVELFKGTSKNGGLEKIVMEEDSLARLVQDGITLLDSKRLSPGIYDVVTDPEWSGIIAHECFGHGMETDLYVRERALSRRYLGQPIASYIVNMFDDPSLVGEGGGFFFDDEGQPASKTHIIENGILKRGLTDLASAHALKMDRSANGRRESFARKAYARMTNTFFAPGKNTKEEIIASIKDGLYLRYATNGMEDPQAWGIQVEGLWAEEIKNGKLTGKVYSPVIMTGFVPDLLQSISMVGNDLHISGLGMCGKGHKEWVKNTTGGPHLKLKARLA